MYLFVRQCGFLFLARGAPSGNYDRAGMFPNQGHTHMHVYIYICMCIYIWPWVINKHVSVTLNKNEELGAVLYANLDSQCDVTLEHIVRNQDLWMSWC